MEFAVEDVPPELNVYDSDVLEDGEVPLARLLPGRPGRHGVPPRIVLYRRPLEFRAMRPGGPGRPGPRRDHRAGGEPARRRPGGPALSPCDDRAGQPPAAWPGDAQAARRLSRRRSRSESPPQMPNRSSWPSAYSRHSASTSHRDADPLRLAGRAPLLREERLRVGLRAQRPLLPLRRVPSRSATTVRPSISMPPSARRPTSPTQPPTRKACLSSGSMAIYATSRRTTPLKLHACNACAVKRNLVNRTARMRCRGATPYALPYRSDPLGGNGRSARRVKVGRIRPRDCAPRS